MFLWRLCICPVHLHSPGANCCLLDPATVYRDHMLPPTQPRCGVPHGPAVPQIRTCCCLTTTAGNVLPWRAYLVETRAELWHGRRVQRTGGFSGDSPNTSHGLLHAGAKFGVDSTLDYGHFSWRNDCVEDSESFKSTTITVSLKIRISLGLSVIYIFFFLVWGQKEMKDDSP